MPVSRSSSAVLAVCLIAVLAACSDKDNADSGQTPDGGATDGGTTDGGSADGGTTDGGSADGGTTDGGSADGGTTDGGSPDGGAGDGGTDEAHWSYDGKTGPAYWGELSEDWATCGDGVEQSPIDLPSGVGNEANLSISYHETPLAIFNNGHTVEVEYAAGGTIDVHDTRYELEQFHFHALSEHTVDGEHADLELHLVHKAEDGAYAVMAILIDEGAENEALADVWAHLPTELSDVAEEVKGVSLNIIDALPPTLDYYEYQGSLTTPPCTEGVTWLVVKDHITMSPDQIAAFQALYDHNYRPVQPLGDRQIQYGDFTYSGAHGPEHWAELSDEYVLCGSGTEQSPIDITTSIPHADDLEFAYTELPVAVWNNGHTVEVPYDKGGALLVGGVEYPVEQFHFHSLSEHTLDGAHDEIEMHIVHKTEHGETAVVAVMIEQGADNEAFRPVWDALPTEETDAPVDVKGQVIDVTDLLPGDRSYYTYDGSLTTPPCTEGVAWYVLSTPIELSASQIDAFQAIYDHNYRPLQDLNGRTVTGGGF